MRNTNKKECRSAGLARRNGIAPHFNVMILAHIFSLFREGLSVENSEVMSEFLDYYLCDREIWKIPTLLLSSTLVPMPDS